MTDSNESKNSQNKKIAIIGIIVILLSVNAVQFFMNVDKSETIETQEQTIHVQKADITKMVTKLDSVETELKQKKAEILKLGGRVDELDALLTQVQRDKKKLQREKNYAVADLERYKGKVEALTLQLNVSDERIARLTAQRDSLYKFNRNLEKKIEQRNDSIRLLAHTKQELEKQVTIAAALEANNIKVDAITDRGKVKEGPELKARHLYKLRVTFNLPSNEVAVMEGKDIYLRIVEPDGATIFNTAMGGGMFEFEGKEIPYTLHQNILFENNNQQETFTFLKGSPFREGHYKAELYSEGFKIGETNFVVD